MLRRGEGGGASLFPQTGAEVTLVTGNKKPLIVASDLPHLYETLPCDSFFAAERFGFLAMHAPVPAFLIPDKPAGASTGLPERAWGAGVQRQPGRRYAVARSRAEGRGACSCKLSRRGPSSGRGKSGRRRWRRSIRLSRTLGPSSRSSLKPVAVRRWPWRAILRAVIVALVWLSLGCPGSSGMPFRRTDRPVAKGAPNYGARSDRYNQPIAGIS
jgi:hypothetical protein